MLSTVSRLKKSFLAVVAISGLTLGLAACQSTTESSTGSQAVEFHDAWTKAGDHMTGVFGELVNNTGEDLLITDVETSVAGITEMHETVVNGGNLVMQEVDGGFSIPAKKSLLLEPGADHIMLMDLKRDLLPGEQIDLTISFSDGSSSDFKIEVRDFAGAIEEYAPGDHDEHMHEHADEHENG